MTEQDQRLIRFARATLQILNDTTEWGPDELDLISDAAVSQGLADHNADGMFRMLPEIVSNPGPAPESN